MRNKCSLYTKGDEFMQEQLMKTHDELRDKMKKYDEAILELLKRGHRTIITQTIKDYLSQPES